MTRPMLGTALAASLLWMQAGAASAQNTTEPATGTTPPTGSAPAAPTPPPAPAPAPTPPAPSEAPVRTEVIPVPVVVPQTSPPPSSTIELEDQPYPNGFGDPNAAFGNDMSVAVRQESDGFDWGLLGLLGLFGLFGLYRRREGYQQVVRSERYEDGRPPIRPDR